MTSDLVPRPGSGVIDSPVIDGGQEKGDVIGSMEAASFTTDQPYRFIGNELYADNGLGLYDFKARLYDPATGRFLSVDPLAEKYTPFGTYGYCGGNPIRFEDICGYDWRDKVMGLVIGAATNIVSVPSLRDAYSPNDSFDYNAGLKVADDVSKIGGLLMISGGATAQMIGMNGATEGAALCLSGVGIPEGITVTGISAITVSTGETMTLFGSYMMSNVSRNQKDGYQRGKKEAGTSREARREAMRQKGIPTSQQPISQSKNASGREYMYEIETPDGKMLKSVQQQTLDSSHPNQPHWEAGSVKIGDGRIEYNRYNRPKLLNGKSKVNY